MAIGGLVNTRTSFNAQTKVLQAIVTHRAKKVPPFFPMIFREIDNDPKRSSMDIGSLNEMGLMYQKNEGEPPAFDQPFEGIPSHFEFNTFGLGCSVTREAQFEDPLALMSRIAPMLTDSETVSKDLYYMSTFNQGFSNAVTLYDGQPLFSANHLLSAVPGDAGPYSKTGATYSNLIGAVQPSPEVLRQAELLFELGLSDRGLPNARTAKYLMCAPQAAKTWQEIIGTPYAPNSNQNTINTEYNTLEILANRYLTNAAAWFVMGAPCFPDGDGHMLVTSHKWQNDVWTWYDEPTRSWNISQEFRSTWGAIDWRGLVGSPGAGP